MAYRDHVAILTVGYRKAEREGASAVIAAPVTEGGDIEDLGFAVAHDDVRVAVDIGVSVTPVTRLSIRRYRTGVQAFACQHERPSHGGSFENLKAIDKLRAEEVDGELVCGRPPLGAAIAERSAYLFTVS